MDDVYLNDRGAMRRIQRTLDGTEWTCDTLDVIAEIMRAAGYEIREPDGDSEGRDAEPSRPSPERLRKRE